MRDKWIWLVAPLAVLVAGLNFVWWFQAETNKAESCRYLRKANSSPDPRWPRLGEVLMANSLMRGMCHHQDVAKGIEMFERLLADGAGDYIAVYYYMALQHVGDEERMARWLNPAAATYRIDSIAMLEVLPRRDRAPIELQNRAARMFAATNGDRPYEAFGVVREMLAQGFLTRTAERTVLDRALKNLSRLDPVEGAYRMADAIGKGLAVESDPTVRFRFYGDAATCGHARAIIDGARQWMEQNLALSRDETAEIVASLVVLERFGGVDPELLDAAIRKSGTSRSQALNGSTPDAYRDDMHARCVRKFGAAGGFRIPG